MKMRPIVQRLILMVTTCLRTTRLGARVRRVRLKRAMAGRVALREMRTTHVTIGRKAIEALVGRRETVTEIATGIGSGTKTEIDEVRGGETQ